MLTSLRATNCQVLHSVKPNMSTYYFRDCQKRTHTPISGKLTGEIPSWLNGSLIRNGPGIQTVGKDKYNHMFDGMAVLHRFNINNGKVTYNSRELESDTFHKNNAAQRIVVTEFGTVGIGDPCDTLFNKFKSLFISAGETSNKLTDNCSVSAVYHGDQLYAMTESNVVRRIDPTSLKTIGEKSNIAKYIAIHFASAHPHVLEDGTVINLGINFRHPKGATHLVVKTPPTFGSKESNFKDIEIVAEIPSRWNLYPGYNHSFGLTQDKIVFVEQPYCFRVPQFILSQLSLGFYRVNARDVLKWYPNEKTRIHVVSFKNGKPHPIIYETDNLFVFHHANTYEEDGHLICDMTAYDTAEYVNSAMDHNTMGTSMDYTLSGCTMRRYVLPLHIKDEKAENLITLKGSTASAKVREGSKGTIVDVKPEILLNQLNEFPRINYKFNGLKYKYVYGGLTSSSKNFTLNDLYKLDTDTKEVKVWKSKDNVMLSEPVFVQNPNITSPKEDDGVILTNILYADEPNKTSLLVINAKNMKELGRVDFVPEGAMTTTFHGQWANTADTIHRL